MLSCQPPLPPPGTTFREVTTRAFLNKLRGVGFRLRRLKILLAEKELQSDPPPLLTPWLKVDGGEVGPGVGGKNRLAGSELTAGLDTPPPPPHEGGVLLA